jgi:hypothetical protein
MPLLPRFYDPASTLSERTTSSRAHDRPLRQRDRKEPAQLRINGDWKFVFKTNTAS